MAKNWNTNHHIKSAVTALEGARNSAVQNDGNAAMGALLLALKGIVDELDGAPVDPARCGTLEAMAAKLRVFRHDLGMELDALRKGE